MKKAQRDQILQELYDALEKSAATAHLSEYTVDDKQNVVHTKYRNPLDIIESIDRVKKIEVVVS